MAANPIDLTTLADVKTYLGITATSSDDTELQNLITGASQYWLTRTGRASLNSVVTVANERYDGNGRDTLMLRQWPIQSVTSLTVNGFSVPASPDYIQYGYVIDQRQTAIVILGAGTYGGGGYGVNFCYGRLNVNVSYTAGYSATPLDVAEAVIKQVAQNYKRRRTTDEEMISIPQTGGTTRLRDWSIPPECLEVLNAYRRWWI